MSQQRERMAAAERNHAAVAEPTAREARACRARRCARCASASGERWRWWRRGARALAEHELHAARKDAQARDLRRQIEDLRAQLAPTPTRMEDLSQGRERVAQRTREGVTYERSFTEATDVIIAPPARAPGAATCSTSSCGTRARRQPPPSRRQARRDHHHAVGMGAPPAALT